MRAPSVKTTRRLLIGVVTLTLCGVLFNYLQTWIRRSRAVKIAPEILSSEMKRSAVGIDHSEYRDGILRFKIKARRLLEPQSGKSILEGFEAHDFNPDGSIRNEIRCKNAEYDPDRKIANFTGDVRLFIGKRLEVRTNSLRYDLNAGIGTTPDSLQFYSEQVRGTARGLLFDRNQQSVNLSSAVDLNLTREVQRGGSKGTIQAIHATSEQAHFSELTDRILFQGNARVASGTQMLSGQKIEAALNQDQKHIQTVTAEGNAQYQFEAPGEKRTMSGDRMVFKATERGTLEKVNISGQASFSALSSAKQQNMHGEGGDVEILFDAKEFPTQVTARTAVLLDIKRGAEHSLISGDLLDARFATGTKRLESIDVRNNARLSRSGPGADGNELQANEIRMRIRDLNGRSVLEKLHAEGAAKYKSIPAAKEGSQERASRTLSASILEFDQSAEGDYLESGSASGNVVILENTGDQSARPQLKQLKADKAGFHFFPVNNQIRDLDAEGHVQVFYENKGGSAKKGVLENFATSSDQMNAHFALSSGRSIVDTVSQSGNFQYTESDNGRSASSGGCDYYAQKALLVLSGSPVFSDRDQTTTGNKIEYDRNKKELHVHGNVKSTIKNQKGSASYFGSSSSSFPAIVTAEEMTNQTETGQARYAGKVRLVTDSQRLYADLLEFSTKPEQMHAEGSVRHEMNQQAQRTASAPGKKSQDPSSAPDKMMTIRSSSMRYSKEQNKVNYSDKVTLHSEDADVSSESLDIFLDSDGKKPKRAKAEGNVVAHFGVRECRGDTGEYFIDPPEKFIMVGNPAELYEPGKIRSRNARRLTYNRADDTIQLEN